MSEVYYIIAPVLWTISLGSIAAWVYMYINRGWPPMATKQIELMGIHIVCGSMWVLVQAFGFSPNRPWDYCEITFTIADLLGVACWSTALACRFFLLEDVLVHHKTKFPPLWKRFFKIWVWLPLGHWMIYLQYPTEGIEWSRYNEDGTCPSAPSVFPPDDSALSFLQPLWAMREVVITLIPYLVLYFFLIRSIIRLKNVKSQFNEFNETIIAFGLSFSAFFPVALGLSIIPQVLIYFFGVQAVFWSILGKPFYHLIQGDKEYLHKFTYGFDEMPSADMLTANLENQLAVPAVREQFRKFAGDRFAAENLDFYEACLERDKTIGWFERQALTMGIIDTFIVNGAPKEVNIPDRMKQNIFNGNVNDIMLFEPAKREIMQLMTTNMGAEFANTKEMIGMKESAAEMERLRLAGLTKSNSQATIPNPGAPPKFISATSSSAGLLERVSSDLNRSDVDLPGAVDGEKKGSKRSKRSKGKRKGSD